MSTLVTLRRFKDLNIPAHIKRPLRIRTQEDKKTWVPELYKQGWKNKAQHEQVHLQDLYSIEEIGVIITDNNLLIVDFDTDIAYEDALDLNSTLPVEQQCGFIVHSSRKGGHFYYTATDSIMDLISPLHSDKTVTSLDILYGGGHNAFAPTQGDSSKTPLPGNSNVLTQLPISFIYYINSIVLAEASSKSKQIYLVSKEGYSDDNHTQVEGYVLGKMSPEAFYSFYSLPDSIPAGESWKTLQSLSFRLLKDETLSHDIVLKVLDKYDPDHRQSHTLLAPYAENIYNPDKKNFSLTLTERNSQTPISVYFDRFSGDYIVNIMEDKGNPEVHSIASESRAKLMLESLTGRKRSSFPWPKIETVKATYSYLHRGGLDLKSKTFNKAYINIYLTAFKGTRPDDYTTPQGLIDLTAYMWGDEQDYLLASAQYRYKTFEHSPVVTHIMGTEGSGKNLTVTLLTRGFTEDSQELDYTLFMDKHANHQVQPNTILGEVGDWNPAEKKGALAKIKTQSGNGGKATIRGMQKEAQVVDTINKIWVLGNSWMRLHTDPVTQRRVHAVYMPQSLKTEAGGRYSSQELEDLLSDNNLVNFYYWLGNEFQPESTFTKTEYSSAICRQHSRSYDIYVEATEGPSDSIIRLVTKRTYTDLLKALALADSTIDDVDYKWNKQNLLVVAITSLKLVFGRLQGADAVYKALDTVAANYEANKLLIFNGSPEKYMTVYDSPLNLGETKQETILGGRE